MTVRGGECWMVAKKALRKRNRTCFSQKERALADKLESGTERSGGVREVVECIRRKKGKEGRNYRWNCVYIIKAFY